LFFVIFDIFHTPGGPDSLHKTIISKDGKMG
jgi:hypothetical protein